MASTPAARAVALVDDYLLAWVVLAAAVGVAVPPVGALGTFSTPILAVMVGSVSLTLAPERSRTLRARTLVGVLLAGTTMPVVAYVIARLLEFPPELAAGFVLVGAVPPVLVAPTLIDRGGGDATLATAVLLLAGVVTLGAAPASLALVSGTGSVGPLTVVRPLLVAVVVPAGVGVAARRRWSGRVSRYDRLFPSISGLMAVVLVGVLTATNAAVLRDGGGLVALVGTGSIALNLAGYGVGWLTGRWLGLPRPGRIATTLSVGTRDFAVAAAVVAAAGFPTVATLPAIVFGLVEMTTAAGLASWLDDTGP